jgi:myosin heavy subunit
LTLQKQRPDEFINVGGADNLANLSELTEEKILEEIKTRYFTHNIQASFLLHL